MSGPFYTGIEPRRLLPRTPNPCPACLRELRDVGEDLAALFADELADEDANRCFAHLNEMPTALVEAIHETARLPAEAERKRRKRLPTTAELEAARQWSARLGRPVYPGERIDALAHLIAEGRRTP